MFECYMNTTTATMESIEVSSSEASQAKKDPMLPNLDENGHEVVAYPNLALSKSTEPEFAMGTGGRVGSTSTRRSLLALKRRSATKPRSLSAGRARPTGRDLVNDVYQRLGVERPEYSSAVAGLSERGRSPGLSTAEDQRRARSLSRGRMRNRWPPPNAEVPTTPTKPTKTVRDLAPASPKSRVYGPTTDDCEPTSPASPQRGTYKTTAANVYRNSREERAKEVTSLPTSKSMEWRKPAETDQRKEEMLPRAIQSSHSMDWNDEKKDSENPSEDGYTSLPSVKDRMRVFGDDIKEAKKASASKVSRRPVDKQYAAQFAVRELPPKINIYASGKNNDKMIDNSPFDEKKNDQEDPDDGHHEQKKPTSEAGSAKSSQSAPSKTNIAEAFLAAIHSPTPSTSSGSPRKLSTMRNDASLFAPVTEVVSEEDISSVTENVSLLSTTSEDLGASPQSGHRGPKKSWNRVPAYTPGTNQYMHTTSPLQQRRGTIGGSSYSNSSNHHHHHNHSNGNNNDAAIEKMVDDRVRARVGEIERNMLDQLQTFMARMDERMEARVGRLERTIQTLLREQQQK